jgi:hypothetical protein
MEDVLPKIQGDPRPTPAHTSRNVSFDAHGSPALSSAHSDPRSWSRTVFGFCASGAERVCGRSLRPRRVVRAMRMAPR